MYDPGHDHDLNFSFGGAGQGGATPNVGVVFFTPKDKTGNRQTGIHASSDGVNGNDLTASKGGDGFHNNLGPRMVMNAQIKLG
jgi:hypothetical protein